MVVLSKAELFSFVTAENLKMTLPASLDVDVLAMLKTLASTASTASTTTTTSVGVGTSTSASAAAAVEMTEVDSEGVLEGGVKVKQGNEDEVEDKDEEVEDGGWSEGHNVYARKVLEALLDDFMSREGGSESDDEDEE